VFSPGGKRDAAHPGPLASAETDFKNFNLGTRLAEIFSKFSTRKRRLVFNFLQPYKFAIIKVKEQFMPINARSKGAAGEREFCTWLYQKHLVESVPERNLEQVRSGGIDVIPENHPFAYEVKRVENVTYFSTYDKWWLKAVMDCRAIGREPVVAHRKNRGNWTFLISLENLLGVPGSFAILKSVAFVKYAQKRIAGYDGRGS